MAGTAASSAKQGSFANLLAGFAAQPRASEERGDDGLRDDIATISYEQALRAHARTRHVEPLPVAASPAAASVTATSAAAAPEPEPEARAEETPAADPRFTPQGRKPPVSVRISEWSTTDAREAALSARRKTASVTIRLSAAENTQLHERAAAAGMTASAYLRSCLFEAEALRAQVKEALDQFRAVPAQGGKTGAHDAEPHTAHARRAWQLPRWLGGDHAKSA